MPPTRPWKPCSTSCGTCPSPKRKSPPSPTLRYAIPVMTKVTWSAATSVAAPCSPGGSARSSGKGYGCTYQAKPKMEAASVSFMLPCGKLKSRVSASASVSRMTAEKTKYAEMATISATPSSETNIISPSEARESGTTTKTVRITRSVVRPRGSEESHCGTP